MGKRGLKIKITRERAEALYGLHAEMIRQYEPENEHERLLHSHLAAMHGRLQVMLRKDFGRATLHISECEAMAFMQLWGDTTIPRDTYGDVLIHEMMGKVNKAQKDGRVAA